MTARRVSKLFVLLNGVNDTAYFGFLTVQFLLLEPTLRALLPAGQSRLSIGLSMTLITSQLLWQIFAEGPTGAMADVYGRVWAIGVSFWCRLLAVALVVACVVLNLTSDSPPFARVAVATALIAAQVLMGTGEAFLEGSIEAWLRDESEAASPDSYIQIVDRAFEVSAVVQNVAILVTVTTVLVVWEAFGIRGGIILAVLAACLFLVGAAVAQRLSASEAFKRRTGTSAGHAYLALLRGRRAGRAVTLKLRDAFTTVVKADEASVRRLIIVLVLPFPCWILLSWFFTAFVEAGGDSGAFTLWLGVTLGVARVAGALLGKRLSSRRDGTGLRSIFENAVFLNVIFLLGAALLLVLRLLGEGRLPSSVGVALFLTAAALAKGSEEVIKLSKNKFLAAALPNGDVRATTLSFVSVAQNAFGFMAISLSGLLAFMVTDSGEIQTVIIFTACALFGIAGWLVYRRAVTRR